MPKRIRIENSMVGEESLAGSKVGSHSSERMDMGMGRIIHC